MNNTDIVTKIDEEQLNELTKLGTLDPNADEAKDLIKNIQALHQMVLKEKDLTIEDSKIQNDYYLNQRMLDIDELKASKDNKNDGIRARDARTLHLVGFGGTLE